MATLGDFGVEHPPVDDTFGWFGSEIRVHPDLSDLAIIDLFSSMATYGKKDTEAGPDALAAMAGVTALLVHPDDVDAFTVLARRHRQTMEDVASLAMELLAALSGRPTQLPSDSSDGQRSTGTRSGDVSSSPALRLLEGRPDLQAAVVMAERERAASAV